MTQELTNVCYRTPEKKLSTCCLAGNDNPGGPGTRPSPNPSNRKHSPYSATRTTMHNISDKNKVMLLLNENIHRNLVRLYETFRHSHTFRLNLKYTNGDTICVGHSVEVAEDCFQIFYLIYCFSEYVHARKPKLGKDQVQS